MSALMATCFFSGAGLSETFATGLFLKSVFNIFLCKLKGLWPVLVNIYELSVF
jgi:hypothetical protein